MVRWCANKERTVAWLLASLLLVLFAQPVAAEETPFSDIGGGAYYTEPVGELADAGVFDGTECGDRLFCPDEPILRWQMAVWIVRVLDGGDPEPVDGTRFGDVDSDDWYAAHVERMHELNVTKGCGNGVDFCPEQPVKRSQMAVFLTRAFKLPDGPDPGFADVLIDVWYADEVAALAVSGITQGCGDGTIFCPERVATRGQMATFLHRAINREEVGEQPSSRVCDFSDHSDAIRAAVFQVQAGASIGTAFYVGHDEWMTAAHVVEGEGSVTLNNGGTRLQAVVLGSDTESDMALLKASGKGIRSLRFGRLDHMKAGEPLYAVGFPLYVASEPSVARGVLSRTEEDASLGRVIVTDASVNPGNSGGPLVDECGYVMGMIVSKQIAEEVEGIGYAVAETTLQERIPALHTGGPESVTPSAEAIRPAVPSDWDPFDGENLAGQFVGALTFADVSEVPRQQELLALVVRCTKSTTLEVYLDLTSASIEGDRAYVDYRFGDQTSPTGIYGNPGVRPTAVFLHDVDTFLHDLRFDTSGRLFVGIWDYSDYTYIDDTYDYQGGGQLGVLGVDKHVEPVLAACGYQ